MKLCLVSEVGHGDSRARWLYGSKPRSSPVGTAMVRSMVTRGKQGSPTTGACCHLHQRATPPNHRTAFPRTAFTAASTASRHPQLKTKLLLTHRKCPFTFVLKARATAIKMPSETEISLKSTRSIGECRSFFYLMCFSCIFSNR